MLTEKNKVFTICRKTLPALKATALKDFMEILKSSGKFREENFTRSDHVYYFGTNEIEFISADNPQKLRGRKRNYLWLNEANEMDYEDYRQLLFRTTEQVYLDFNPSDEFHWIYDFVLTRDDCTFIKSTYLDNPFLNAETVKEIERVRHIDANYWRIYGLGERGISETTIYSNWELIDELPEGGDTYYGLDFGFNNCTSLNRVVEKDMDIYVDELIYESGLTNSDLIKKMGLLGINRISYIYSDSAEPQRIEELRRSNFNAKSANKDVLKGIDTMKSRRIFITKRSLNIIKEIRSYRWKEKDGKPLDEPVKVNDHAMDSIRYAVHTKATKPFIGIV
jgi:phage terminase large subunit